MKARPIHLGLLLLPLLCVIAVPARAQTGNAGTVSFVSLWNDFKVDVPVGWKATYNNESTHFTETSFASPDSRYKLLIRWYTRYSTHRLSDGMLEMYSTPDDFSLQLTKWYGKDLIEPSREVTVADGKGRQFEGRVRPDDNPYTADPVKDGARVGDKQVWTALPPPPKSYSSGFYVLAYFAPEDSFATYENQYDQMLASFTQLKDGPDGALLPGVAQQAASTDPLQRDLELIKTHRDVDLQETSCKSELNFVTGKQVTRCNLFGSTSDLRKQIIEDVATMQPAPPIPDEAVRHYAEGSVFMKSVKGISDYNLVIAKYKEALVEAPWWGDAYYNLGIVFIAAERYDEAKQALQFYLLTKPVDAAKAQKKIYEIDAQLELQQKHEAEMASKYGSRHSGTRDYKDLYVYGAVVQDMSFDSSGNVRTVSLKIVTHKEWGRFINYFHIFDITSPNDISGQQVNADWTGTQTFALGKHGSTTVNVTVTSYGDGDANITVAPSYNASASIKTSLTSLLRERASQAVYAGTKVNVGTKDFYMLGEGGFVGASVFFPIGVKDLLDKGSVQDLMPTLVCNTSNTTTTFRNSDLGVVDGTHYHMEWNGSSEEIKVGQGENH